MPYVHVTPPDNCAVSVRLAEALENENPGALAGATGAEIEKAVSGEYEKRLTAATALSRRDVGGRA